MKTNCENTTLLERIAAGDELAFKQLFDRYYQKLFHLALYFLRTRELAEETVADVFYIIWKKRAALPTIEHIEYYLYTSVKNQALHYIRRTLLPEPIPLELYQIQWLPDTDNPERAFLDQEYRDLIQEAILSLPDKCREVFRLVLSDRLKHKEIACLLDISEKTVEAHIATAYKKIALYVNKKYSHPQSTRKLPGIFF